MKYRKKPVVIEAYLFDPTNGERDFPEWMMAAIQQGTVRVGIWLSESEATMRINTPEGAMAVNVGDYIIKGVKGELYPCKPDIFKATHEAVKGRRSIEQVVAEWNAFRNDIKRWEYLIQHGQSTGLEVLLDNDRTLVRFKQGSAYDDLAAHHSEQLNEFYGDIGDNIGLFSLLDAIGIASDSA